MQLKQDTYVALHKTFIVQENDLRAQYQAVEVQFPFLNDYLVLSF